MIVRWVFALLVRLLRGVNLIPLVGGANRLLGLVLGLVTGAFDCWLLALLLWFAASITTGQIDWIPYPPAGRRERRPPTTIYRNPTCLLSGTFHRGEVNALC